MATNRKTETSNYIESNDDNGRNGDDNASNTSKKEHNEVNLTSVCLAYLSRRSFVNSI